MIRTTLLWFVPCPETCSWISYYTNLNYTTSIVIYLYTLLLPSFLWIRQKPVGAGRFTVYTVGSVRADCQSFKVELLAAGWTPSWVVGYIQPQPGLLTWCPTLNLNMATQVKVCMGASSWFYQDTSFTVNLIFWPLGRTIWQLFCTRRMTSVWSSRMLLSQGLTRCLDAVIASVHL